MRNATLLTPNEVAVLANTSKSVVEKAVEQRVLASARGVHAKGRFLPLHAVAVAAAAKSLGRRLTVSDKKLVARELASLSPAALKTAKIEVAPSVVLHIGSLAREAIERALRYAAARDSWIETAEGVQGSRPVIRGTRLTVSAIFGRLSSGDAVEDLMADYPDIPRDAFEAAFIYGKSHPQVGRPVSRRSSKAA
jgi:uncharacterized protein (DUF433 family)